MTDDFKLSSLTWVFNPADLTRLLGALTTCREVVIDLETTGLDEHAVTNGTSNRGVAARIALASITLPQPDDSDEMHPTTWVIPLSHPKSPWRGRWRAVMKRIAVTIDANNTPIVNHNVKFDIRWITATTGVNLSRLIRWDTMLSSNLLDENRPAKLKTRAPDTFNIPAWDDVTLNYPGAAEDEDLFTLGVYAARDTYWTWRLAELHRRTMFVPSSRVADPGVPEFSEEFEDARLGTLATRAVMPMMATLTQMEQRGILLDRDWIEEQTTEHEKAAHSDFQTLIGLYPQVGSENASGTAREPSFSPSSLYFRDWADAAVAAGDLRVASLTPSGRPQWSKSVLVRQKRKGSEVAELLLSYRDHVKKLEFLRSWLAQAAPNGRIYATYNAGSVVTGRLSSSGPNMQQVTKALKPAFIPSPGHVFVELDYSQIELRIAAFVSRSPSMLAAFRNGEDLHRILASRISGKPVEDITDAERKAAKAANFGLLYGMGVNGFREYAETAYEVELSEDDALTFHRTFFETWDGLSDWHLRAIHTARRDGQIVSPIGRVRRVPNIFADDLKLSAEAERHAINSPVQGFGSDLMQMSASWISGNLPHPTKPGEFLPALDGVRLVGTVHDSILVEVPADRWDEAAKACQRRMESIGKYVRAVFGVHVDVPLESEYTVMDRWGTDNIQG